ncbi:DUF5984 family protein [Methylocystis sp. S23]|jgi:hypothetical protein
MLFNFTLRPLDQATPWGGPEKPSLHWFGLTEGEYWIEAGEATIFEYSDAALRRFGGSRHCDYYVVRLHEDLLAILPQALDPAPRDLRYYLKALLRAYDRAGAAPEFARRLERLREAGPDDAALEDAVDRAVHGLGSREFCASYLTAGPAVAIWSDDDLAHIAWNTDNRSIEGVPAWSARSGEFSLPRETLAREVADFHDRLMAAMEARVDAVRKGALAPGIAIDLDELAREQEKRRREIERALRPPEPPTDWEAVREAVRFVEARTI